MKNVACYCRVSTEEQKKFGFSIEAQKDALEKYCRENGYKYEFYIDEGISASSMRKRKALNEMLSKVNVFDMILFTKLDRLSRNVLDANNINKLLIDNKCTMKAIDEDDIDTSTADGTFIFNLKVSLAQREIGKTSERIKFVFENKRNKGEVTSGTKKYGYDIVNRKFEINPSEAENIVNLYKYFIDVNGNMQETYKYFIEHFENKGFDALQGYLKDTAYIGKYKLYRKEIYLENYIPAIVNIDLWNQVQNLRKKKTISRGQPIIDKFSGLIYCYNCHNRMSKKIDNRCKNKVVRYVCDSSYRFLPGTTKKRCSNSSIIREENIEEYLLNNLKKELSNYKFKVNLQTTQQTQRSDTALIKKLENKLLKLKDLYLDDLIDKDTYTKDYKKYSTELEQLKYTPVVEIKRDFSYVEKIINSDYFTIYNKLTTENKKKFWMSFVDKIYVENGEIKEVTFL